jgi:mRNA interferase MazF
MQRGDVVVVNWPYSDLTGSKLRPAVVVKSDMLNGLIDDTILVKITGTRYGIPATEVKLDPVDESASALCKASFAACNCILTRDQATIGRTIGSLSSVAMRQIESCLKAVLELP